MLKSVFKEIIIILLLVLIIILLLGIMFYEYIPSSITVPEKVQEYALEETVKQELDKELNNMNSEEIVKTYQIDATDIEKYEKTNEYNKGKVNPFEKYSEKVENENDNTNNNINTNSGENNTSSNNNTKNPSKDNFLNTTGK